MGIYAVTQGLSLLNKSKNFENFMRKYNTR